MCCAVVVLMTKASENAGLLSSEDRLQVLGCGVLLLLLVLLPTTASHTRRSEKRVLVRLEGVARARPMRFVFPASASTFCVFDNVLGARHTSLAHDYNVTASRARLDGTYHFYFLIRSSRCVLSLGQTSEAPRPFQPCITIGRTTRRQQHEQQQLETSSKRASRTRPRNATAPSQRCFTPCWESGRSGRR